MIELATILGLFLVFAISSSAVAFTAASIAVAVWERLVRSRSR